MTRTLAAAATALLLALTVTACGGGGGDKMSTGYGDVPTVVVEQVRAEFPQTRADDIAYQYRDAKSQDPDASNDDIVRWIIEVEQHNRAVDSRRCMFDPTLGREVNCPPISDDNPFAW